MEGEGTLLQRNRADLVERRAEAAEHRSAELQTLIDRDLAELHATVLALAAEWMRTSDSAPASESLRPRRRGLLGLLLGR